MFEPMAKKEIIVKESSEVIANCDNLPQGVVESRIFTIRGVEVILDRDLAEFYSVPTSRLNEQAKRNQRRFPTRFRFQLTPQETAEVIANCDRLAPLKFSPTQPYAYTEQGVAMLSAVLHSKDAEDISVRIMDGFVAMRRFLASNAQVFQRLEQIEYKLLEDDHKFEQIFSKLEEKSLEPKQGIFYDGQIYDSYTFVNSLIKAATKSIVLIDNYVDETVLTMLDKRETGVDATIYTFKISNQFKLDIAKHEAQYPAIPVKVFTKAHDRFLVIDDKVYHIGASLKDLGKKWFAFSLMENLSPSDLISRLI